MKELLRKFVTEEDWLRIIAMLVEKAQEGDLEAAELLLGHYKREAEELIFKAEVSAAEVAAAVKFLEEDRKRWEQLQLKYFGEFVELIDLSESPQVIEDERSFGGLSDYVQPLEEAG